MVEDESRLSIPSQLLDIPSAPPFVNTLVQLLYFVLIVGGALAVGGVHTQVVWVLAVVALVGWGVCLVHSWDAEYRERASWSELAFFLFAGAAIIQLVPVPHVVHEWVSPYAAAQFEQTWYAVLGESVGGDRWRSLSLAPGRTADRAVRWLTLGAVAMIAATGAKFGVGWRRRLRIVTAATACVLLVGVGHDLVGASSILGIYTPEAARQTASPFINPNHGAVFYGVGALAATGLTFRLLSHDRMGTTAAALVALASSLVLFEQSSFSATSGFAGAFVLLCIGQFQIDNQSAGRFGLWAAAGLAFVAPVVLLVWLYLSPASLQEPISETATGQWLLEHARTRLSLAEAGIEAIPEFPIVGAGAGSTEFVIAPFVDWQTIRPATIPTIEMQSLEWLMEFGLLVGCLGIVMLVSALAVIGGKVWWASGRRYWTGLAIGVFVAFNTQFHFPWFALGCVLPCVILLAPLVRSCAADVPYASIRIGRPSEAGMWLVGLLAAAGCFWAWTTRPALEASPPIIEETGEPGEMSREAIEWRPTDAKSLVAIAEAFVTAGRNDRAVQVVSRAYEVAPTAQLAIRRARVVYAAGERDRAVEQFREVFGGERFRLTDEIRRGWVSRLLVPSVDRPTLVARSLETAGPELWRAAWSVYVDQGRAADALTFAVELTDLRAESTEAVELVVEAALASEKHFLAQVWARRIVERGREDSSQHELAIGYKWLARAMDAAGQRSRARSLLVEALGEVSADAELALELIAFRPRDPVGADPAFAERLHEVLDAHCDDVAVTWKRRRCWMGRAWRHEYRENFDEAERIYRRLTLRTDSPKWIVRYLRRRGACVELREFVNEWRTSGNRSDQVESFLKSQQERCKTAPR